MKALQQIVGADTLGADMNDGFEEPKNCHILPESAVQLNSMFGGDKEKKPYPPNARRCASLIAPGPAPDGRNQ